MSAAPALLPSPSADPAAGLPVWRVLDTRFDAGRLFALWQAWQTMAAPPRVLHLVAFSPGAPDPGACRAAAGGAQAAPLAQELIAQLDGLLPGQHRLSLAGGRLQFTLGIGALQPLLREQQFEADALFLDTTLPWDRWGLKALARCCRRGATVRTDRPADAALTALRQAGFVPHEDALVYDPPWTLKTSRAQDRLPAAPVSSCAVVGAGLAGAAVAAVLARRGWQVQVLDAAAGPAAGASGLPAGLLVPHVSADDSPRSRLARAGARLLRAEARRLLVRGQDWDDSGVLERRLDGHAGLPPDWPAAGQVLSALARPDPEGDWRAGATETPELWHAQAAWIKPARLVAAWLAEPGVRFVGQARVQALRADAGAWQLLDRAGRVLARAHHVVLANAADAPRLLAQVEGAAPPPVDLPALHEMRGVLSFGLRRPGDAAALPPFPVNGLGALIPAVPGDEGLAWYAGATYEAATLAPAPAEVHHRSNLDKLRRLLPAAAQQLAADFAPGAARGWGNSRCVSHDRLPLVGPLQEGATPTLWLSAALGSRGLSLALLCAELLAARLGAEPWPLAARLARALDLRRRPHARPAQPRENAAQ